MAKQRRLIYCLIVSLPPGSYYIVCGSGGRLQLSAINNFHELFAKQNLSHLEFPEVEIHPLETRNTTYAMAVVSHVWIRKKNGQKLV